MCHLYKATWLLQSQTHKGLSDTTACSVSSYPGPHQLCKPTSGMTSMVAVHTWARMPARFLRQNFCYQAHNHLICLQMKRAAGPMYPLQARGLGLRFRVASPTRGRTSRRAGAAGAGRAPGGRQRAQRGAAQRHVVRAGVAAHLQQAVARVGLRAQHPLPKSLLQEEILQLAVHQR